MFHPSIAADAALMNEDYVQCARLFSRVTNFRSRSCDLTACPDNGTYGKRGNLGSAAFVVVLWCVDAKPPGLVRA